MLIAPRWLRGTWAFDDPATDLTQEPFVQGIPEMIDELVAEIPDARSGFRHLFSAAPFPGYQRIVTDRREEFGGWWYASFLAVCRISRLSKTIRQLLRVFRGRSSNVFHSKQTPA